MVYHFEYRGFNSHAGVEDNYLCLLSRLQTDPSVLFAVLNNSAFVTLYAGCYLYHNFTLKFKNTLMAIILGHPCLSLLLGYYKCHDFFEEFLAYHSIYIH
jgi:hypothetical protein